MRSLLGYLILSFISIQMTFGQTYLIDSLSMLSLFGNTQTSLDFKKFKYDDQNRIVKIISEFQIRDYEYHNEYDHSILTHNPTNNLFSPREDNFYNENGLIIRQERHAYDGPVQNYSLSSMEVYEYDQDNHIINELHSSFDENGTEYINYSIDFNYLDQKLVNQVAVSYAANIPSVTTTTNYIYSGDYLLLEQQESVANNQNYSYIKDYEYNTDNSLKSIVTYNLDQNDTTHLVTEDYLHSEHAVETLYTYYTFSTNTYTYHEEYNSYVESPFYEKDTFINIEFNDVEEISVESRMQSTEYSQSGDSAFIRREFRFDDAVFFSFLQITKEIHLKIDGSASEIIDEEIHSADVYPSPVSPNSTIIIQKKIDDIDHAEIYNALGQKVQEVNLKNK
ncbi:hypothetical protein N9B82_06920, partial [Saprospiraceae bacterium]|nr:hypothetical protein [Saprospiraceae bacterium]